MKKNLYKKRLEQLWGKNMYDILKSIKYIFIRLYHIICSVCYNLYWDRNRFTIYDYNQTLDLIIRKKVSVSRFGDGEYSVMNNSGNGFQYPNKKLANRLKEVLSNQVGNHIICLPYAFHSVKHMTNNAAFFWKYYLVIHKKEIQRITPVTQVYYDASFTRFYIDFKDKSHCKDVIDKFKMIWKDREVYIIEGENTRLGVGNDLLTSCNSIKRIICPSINAFTQYDRILDISLRNISSGSLVLCALGMTATVLAYDLAKHGFQAIDIGHIDIEYEWYKMGAKSKCPIKNKAVNEVGMNNISTMVRDEKYELSIIARIL